MLNVYKSQYWTIGSQILSYLFKHVINSSNSKNNKAHISRHIQTIDPQYTIAVHTYLGREVQNEQQIFLKEF